MDPSENQCCGSGIRVPVFFVLFWPLDPDPASGMREKSDPVSGMNIPDHISESLETILGRKILKFTYTDPGLRELFDPGFRTQYGQIRIRGPGSGINIADPQHCCKLKLILLLPNPLPSSPSIVTVPSSSGCHCSHHESHDS